MTAKNTDNHLTTSQRAKQTRLKLEENKQRKSETNKQALEKAIAVIQTLRDVSPNMTLNQVLVFLEVAKGCQDGQGVPNLDVRGRTGLPSANMTIIVQSLSSDIYTRGGGRQIEGMGLVITKEAEEDGRAKNLHLTQSGKELATRIINKIHIAQD